MPSILAQSWSLVLEGVRLSEPEQAPIQSEACVFGSSSCSKNQRRVFARRSVWPCLFVFLLFKISKLKTYLLSRFFYAIAHAGRLSGFFNQPNGFCLSSFDNRVCVFLVSFNMRSLSRLLARVEATGARDLLVVFGLFIFGENVFLLKLAW